MLPYFTLLLTGCVYISEIDMGRRLDPDRDGAIWPLDCDDEDAEQGEEEEWYADGDGDGFGDPNTAVIACIAPEGYVYNNLDCDDLEASILPDADEVCDGIDNNCDGTVDDEDPLILYGEGDWVYLDFDGDGHGDPDSPVQACDAGEGFAVEGDDCADDDSGTYPGAEELCDVLDNDCDGETDEDLSIYYDDGDGDGYGDPNLSSCAELQGYVADGSDCDPLDASVYPGSTEVCDETDNDCDGEIDEDAQETYYADADTDGYGDPDSSIQSCTMPAGYVVDSSDCDDLELFINPAADELCDGLDNDCNGAADDDPVDESLIYADTDGDGYGNPNDPMLSCTTAGYVADFSDCDDSNIYVNPQAVELCDGIDNDCSGIIDDLLNSFVYYADSDGDGFGDPDNQHSCLLSGYVVDNSDCDDSEIGINPGAVEILDDQIDQDCDGGDLSCASPVTLTWQVAFQGTEGCAWGFDGNTGGTQGLFSARTEQVESYQPPAGGAICAIRTQFDFGVEGLLHYDFSYDDHFLLAYNGHVLLSSTDSYLTGSGNEQLYDWSGIVGSDMEQGLSEWILGQDSYVSIPEPCEPFWSCNNSQLTAFIHDGELDDLHDVSISQSSVEFSLVTFGDNDDSGDIDGSDCYHSGLDFYVQVDLAD
jgi:hypothetical protein